MPLHRSRSSRRDSPHREPFSLGPSRSKNFFPSVNTPVRRSRNNRENLPPETAFNVKANSPVSDANGSPALGKSSSKQKTYCPPSLPPRPPLPRPSATPSATPNRTVAHGQEAQGNAKRKLILDSQSSAEAATGSQSHEQDSGVTVIIRMRPFNEREMSDEALQIVQRISDDSLCLADQQFTFDHVAGADASQQSIFDMVGLPLVEHCLQGFNSSIFAYGQTGSGKTYTMWGVTHDLVAAHLVNEERGLTPRVFERLFERIKEEEKKHAHKQLRFQCRCSFLEIYNEQITDLLEPMQKNLHVREDTKAGVYVENLTEDYVSSIDDVFNLMLRGLGNRKIGSTIVNVESSRSHCLFTCVIESRCKSIADGVSSVRTSRMNLVDLAGSERQKLTGAAGERLKEAGNINRSLSQLGNLINILAEISQTGKPRHIPYRDSRLTFLLQESLGGNAKLAMICAISSASSCKGETLSTLRFAQRAKSIQNKAVVNEETENDVNCLREQIRQLKDELMRMKSTESQSVGVGSYSTGWNARRSYNLLRMSLCRPMTLPHTDTDTDEEMEIDEEAVEGVDSGNPSTSEDESGKTFPRLSIRQKKDNLKDPRLVINLGEPSFTAQQQVHFESEEQRKSLVEGLNCYYVNLSNHLSESKTFDSELSSEKESLLQTENTTPQNDAYTDAPIASLTKDSCFDNELCKAGEGVVDSCVLQGARKDSLSLGCSELKSINIDLSMSAIEAHDEELNSSAETQEHTPVSKDGDDALVQLEIEKAALSDKEESTLGSQSIVEYIKDDSKSGPNDNPISNAVISNDVEVDLSQMQSKKAAVNEPDKAFCASEEFTLVCQGFSEYLRDTSVSLSNVNAISDSVISNELKGGSAPIKPDNSAMQRDLSQIQNSNDLFVNIATDKDDSTEMEPSFCPNRTEQPEQNALLDWKDKMHAKSFVGDSPDEADDVGLYVGMTSPHSYSVEADLFQIQSQSAAVHDQSLSSQNANNLSVNIATLSPELTGMDLLLSKSDTALDRSELWDCRGGYSDNFQDISSNKDVLLMHEQALRDCSPNQPMADSVLLGRTDSEISCDAGKLEASYALKSPVLSLSPQMISNALQPPTLSVSPRLQEDGRKRFGIDMLPVVAEDVSLEGWPSVTMKSGCFKENDFEDKKPKKDLSLRSSLRSSKKLSSPTDRLAASLHRGLQILENHQKSIVNVRSSLVRCSFRNSEFDIPKSKSFVDRSIQTSTVWSGNELTTALEPLQCEDLQANDNHDNATWELAVVEHPTSQMESKLHITKTAEEILAGALRRERAVEETLHRKDAEIEQLYRLVRQYKYERECNAQLQQSREDKIARLESLMEGSLPTDAFLNEDWSALINEHKILQEKYDHHPEVTLATIKQQRLCDEIEVYRHFVDLGEREALLGEICQLRNQLQCYLDSDSSRLAKQTRLSLAPRAETNSMDVNPECCSSLAVCTSDERSLPQVETQRSAKYEERKHWSDCENEWMVAIEELQAEVEEHKQLAEKRVCELEGERRCADEMKEALQMAMEGHARLLDQYAELQEKHISLLAKHRKIRDGMAEARKKAGKKLGFLGTKWFESQAAELVAIKLEQEHERQMAKEQIETLQAQVRDTADAVQAAGELLVRLKEAEEAELIAQDALALAQQDIDAMYREMEKLKRKHATEIATLQQRLLEARFQRSTVCPMCIMAERVKFQFTEVDAEEAEATLEAEHLAAAAAKEGEISLLPSDCSPSNLQILEDKTDQFDDQDFYREGHKTSDHFIDG